MPKYLFMDSETCETPKTEGQLDVTSGQVYDLGLMVVDETGKIYDQISMVNEDVFFGMPESMKGAYYADKIPQYLDDMRMGKRKIVNSWQMYRKFHEMFQKYDIQAVVAHNAMFDIKVLNTTMRYQTKSRCRWFLPWDTQVLDTMKLAREVYGKDNHYILWCQKNGFMTNHKTPRPRLTAEVLYKYITNDLQFEEEHTGLEDVKIEKEIFLKCMAKMGE